MADDEPGGEPRGPRLPGINPIGGGAAPVIEPVNPLVKLAVQFFLIPMAIVLFCVVLVFVFRMLTYEKQDLSTYVSALSSESRPSSQKQQDALKLLDYIQESKRWQSIYDVTEQLRFNRGKFLKENPDFPERVAQLFKGSAGSDRQVRQYLAQVLGLVGGPSEAAILIEALRTADSETAIHAMVALGRIADPSAIPALVEMSRSEDRGVRQTAVFVLGSFADKAAQARCVEALNDPDLLVTWNAAFALARQGDARAVPVLENFLDEAYVAQATKGYAPTTGSSAAGGEKTPMATFHPERLEQYRATAVRLLGPLQNEAIRKKLQAAAENDSVMKVRQAAIEALKAEGTKHKP